MHMAIACQTDQKFEKFQMMPEFLELVSVVVAGVGAAVENGAVDNGTGDDSAGVIAGVFAVADAATSLCGGTNV